MEIIRNWNHKTLITLFCLVFIIPMIAHAQKMEGQVYKREVELEERFIEAKRIVLLGEPERAEKIYLNLFHEGDEKGLAAYELSRLYHTLDNKDECLKYANTAVLAEPNNEWFLHHLINVASVLQADEDAKSALKKLMKISPEDRPTYEKLVFLHNESREYDVSLDVLTSAEKQFGKQWWIVKEKHRAYHQKGEDVEALQELEAFIENNPNHTSALRTATSFAMNIQDFEKAKLFNDTQLKANPDDKYAQQLKKNIMRRNKSGNEGNKVIADLEAAIQNPDLSLNDKLGRLMPLMMSPEVINSKENNFIFPLVDKMIEDYPDEEKLIAFKADLYNMSGNLMQAVPMYKQVLEKNKAIFTVWQSLMSCLNDLKAYDELSKVAEETMDIYPNQSYPYYYLAITERQKGNQDEALSLLEEAELIASEGDVILDYLHVEKSKILESKGELNEARELMNKIHTSKKVDIENRIAVYQFALDNNSLTEKQKQEVGTALKSNPKSAFLHWLNGNILASENKSEEAIKEFLTVEKLGGFGQQMDFLSDYRNVLKKSSQQELLADVEQRIKNIQQFIQSLNQ